MVIIRNTFDVHMTSNYFLLVYLWQGIAIGLDVTCLTRVVDKQRSITEEITAEFTSIFLSTPSFE